MNLWNENRGPLPSVTKLTDDLTRKIRARQAEEPSLDYWVNCFRKVAASEFCRSKRWASFHWLMKNSENHAKATAGNYDNAGANGMTDDERWAEARRLVAEDGLV